MTLSHKLLKRVNSPTKSPKLTNSSIRRRTLLKRLSSNGVQFGAASKANLKVVVRVRPENQREEESGARSVVDIVDDHMLVFDPKHNEEDFFFQGTKQKFRDLNKRPNKEQKFIFERVFNPSSTNEELFETTTKDIVDTLLSGYNCSVFAYGATGSGKTHTMIGSERIPGITFLTVMELYKKIEELKDDRKCEIGVSYLEVYNEMVQDLLVPGKPLNLRETGQHVQVTGLSLHKPKDAEDLLRILSEGNQNRSQHPTDANAESSRSHAVFQVFLRQQNRSSDLKSGITISKLSMIDLAGSERGAATGFKGARFREGANINRSLLALGNCINALADGKGHIPYRDSKLTRLLKDSIGGNCRSVMIATITKSRLSFEDTFNTLRYANRAKTIKTTLKKNIVNVDQHVSQYLKVVEGLKEEIIELKRKLKEYEEKPSFDPVQVSDVGIADSEKEMYEETIMGLKQQLQEKEDESSANSEFLNKLNDMNLELRSRKREALELETRERELEKNIYIQRLHVIRMNIFSFASSKLDKGIAKSNRSIQSYEKHLAHVLERKEAVQNKIRSISDNISTFYREHKEKLVGKEGNLTPEIIVSKRKEENFEQGARDSYQITKYLENLVQTLLAEQAKNEKLISLLLVALKHFYLKLRSVKECDRDTDNFLEQIYAMLDESRIEWADLKNTNDSFGEQVVSEHIQLPTIDASKLITFPVLQSVDISPVLVDPNKMYKRSNLKKSSGSVNLLPQHTDKSLDVTFTPVSTKKSFVLNEVPLETVERRDALLQDSAECTSRNSTFTSPDFGEYSCRKVSPQTLSTLKLDIAESSVHLLPASPNSDEDSGNIEREDESREKYSSQNVVPSSFIPREVKEEGDDSAVQNFTFTCDMSEDSSQCKSRNVSDPKCSQTFSSNESELPLNSFGANETFNVTEEEYDRTSSADNVLQVVPPSAIKNKENIIRTGHKKLGNGLTPSKFSSSRLSSCGTKMPMKGMGMKSTSVSSLHNVMGRSGNQGKGDNLRKSVSGFIRPKISSAVKNQENSVPRTTAVAFGSSFPRSPKLSSKKRLPFNTAQALDK